MTMEHTFFFVFYASTKAGVSLGYIFQPVSNQSDQYTVLVVQFRHWRI